MSSQESGLEEPCKEWFDFSYRGGRSKGSKAKLLEMKQDDFFKNRTPGTFTIDESLNWNEVHGWTLLEMFFYFHEKGIVWDELIIHTKDSERFVRPLLHAVNTMNIFKNLCVIYKFGDDDHSDFCPGITSNKFAEMIELIICGRHLSVENCLALNNLLQTNVCCLQTLVFEWVISFTNYRNILPGLRNNTNLKELEFKFDGVSGVTDRSTAAIVEAVARNPSLEILKMWFGFGNGIGDLSSEAFMRLLSDSTSLRQLWLCSKDNNQRLNAEYIIQGLKNSRSLERLTIYQVLYGDLIFARIFRILPDCPLLEHIEFSNDDNAFISEEDLAQVKLLPRLPRPIRFTVRESQKFSDCQLELLSELLRYHPEVMLRLRVYESLDIFSKTEFIHLLHMNSHGKYLLDRPNVPLSIWPLVLEKVNTSNRVMDKPSIIYDFLKGPAWGGRSRYEKGVE